jgi:hypothetical protein
MVDEAAPSLPRNIGAAETPKELLQGYPKGHGYEIIDNNVPKSGDEFVSIFKAPQQGKGASQYENGYNIKDFCDGDQCAYFAKEKALADEYAKHYGDGVIELKVPKEVYDSRLKQHEYNYQGGPYTELPVPHSEFDILNSVERIWHQ